MSTIRSWYNESKEDLLKYDNHIEKFIKYVEMIGKSNTPIVINKDDVVDSIGFYNDRGKINTIKSMVNHIEAIKALYKQLVKKKYAEDIFSSIYDYKGWKDFISEKYKINESEEREWFSNDIIIDILTYFEKCKEKNDYKSMPKGREKDRYIKNVLLEIFIKLMLIGPAKRNVIFNLTIDDFICDYRQVKINGIKLAITNSLRRDIKFAFDITKGEIKKDGYMLNFFEQLYGKKLNPEKFNEWFCYVLRQIEFDLPPEKKTYSLEVIANTTIFNMVKNLANPLVIAKISGISLARLEDKFYQIEKDIKSIDLKTNIEISKIPYYQYI